ncbi:MAG: hypothetical protein QOI46_3138, partial [Alphaproteobacteria bacterium]|nr:hypothetical protein [Alphaproteobacteria bacterium]
DLRTISQPDATVQPKTQGNQPMSKHCILGFNFDLSGEAKTAKTKQDSPIIRPA